MSISQHSDFPGNWRISDGISAVSFKGMTSLFSVTSAGQSARTILISFFEKLVINDESTDWLSNSSATNFVIFSRRDIFSRFCSSSGKSYFYLYRFTEKNKAWFLLHLFKIESCSWLLINQYNSTPLFATSDTILTDQLKIPVY